VQRLLVKSEATVAGPQTTAAQFELATNNVLTGATNTIYQVEAPRATNRLESASFHPAPFKETSISLVRSTKTAYHENANSDWPVYK